LLWGFMLPYLSIATLSSSALLLSQVNTRARNRACRKERKRAANLLADDSLYILTGRDDPALRAGAIDRLVRECRACGRCPKPLKAPARTGA